MERHFVLPVAIAAAVHGGLLFGFTRSPRPAPPRQPDARVDRFLWTAPPEEIPVPPEQDATAAGPKAMPDAPVAPASPEPPRADVSSPFTISPPPLQPVNPGDLRNVPLVPRGLTTGDGTDPWAVGIIGSNLLDNTPRARLQTAPIYPFQAKRDGMKGEVVVEFIVDEAGSVLEPRIVRSSHRDFEDASLRAVAKWKFEPGRRDGRIVRFKMAVPVVFNLND